MWTITFLGIPCYVVVTNTLFNRQGQQRWRTCVQRVSMYANIVCYCSTYYAQSCIHFEHIRFHISAQLLLSTGMHSTNCQQEPSVYTVVSCGCTGLSIVNADCVHVTRVESVTFTKRQTYKIPFCCLMLLSLESFLVLSSNRHRGVYTAFCSHTLGWVSYYMHGDSLDVRSDVNISTFSLGTCLEHCSWTLHWCESLPSAQVHVSNSVPEHCTLGESLISLNMMHPTCYRDQQQLLCSNVWWCAPKLNSPMWERVWNDDANLVSQNAGSIIAIN